MNRQKPVKIGKFFFYIPTVIALTASVLLTWARVIPAADTTRILVVPFTINAAADLSYLQRGISDMLTSRLERNNAVVVVTPDSRDSDADVATLAQKINADYMVTGSVTILGDSVSTDAQVVKGAAVSEPVLSFGQTGSRHADVIEHVNALAAVINTRLLDRKPDQPAAVPPVVAIPSPSMDLAVTPPAASSPMPSTAKSQQPTARQDSGPSEPLSVPGIGNIKGQLTGMAAGDVDGNGTDEIVTITSDHLTVYRMAQSRWVKLAEFDTMGDFVGVDAADLNRNGRQEIFVTRFSQNDGRVLSFVLEWDGKSLQRIATQLPWYFRGVEVFQRGRVLAGQSQSQGKRFASGIYEMQWKGDTYAPGERLDLPKKLNIFGFASGALRSPDKPEVVRYNSDGYVQILSPSGEESWVTADHYGGGANFIIFTDEEQWDEQDYIYLSPRIHLHDMDGNGVQEMLVVKNQFSFTGSGVFERQRFYSKGRLEWLKAYDTGIRSVVQTLDLARFIADSALVDIDGDGDLEVVAAVVKKKRGITSKGSSYLVSFGIGPAK